ncbi:hypothetical protein GCM10009788_54990 [Nocardioides humi]|uniref:Low temperature requirement protein LtrA n=2 Tax=Nocardioides humi TaxID=449461 RepID=A0ABN2BQK6_9ACTN
MRARTTDERHRVATPLELLVDLTFVVAVAQTSANLAEQVVHGRVAGGYAAFTMAFFAIWWAWMNFTWFTSAYDTDDVAYRIATFVQMAGVLVLAAGVGDSFASGHLVTVTIGYVVMRLGLVSLWLRAAVQHRPGRRTALRYAAGISVLQGLWLLRLFLGGGVAGDLGSFVVLAGLEMALPVWAERAGGTSWHPHHIAERYGLFAIVLLGESVLAATNAVAGLADSRPRLRLVALSAAGLTILVGLWWLYFAGPAGELLEERRAWSFVWGYGHLAVFAAIAAVGAGLEVVVLATEAGHHDPPPVSAHLAAGAVLVPLALTLASLALVHLPGGRSPIAGAGLAVAATALAALAWAAGTIGAVPAVCGAALVVAVLVAGSAVGRTAGAA